MVERLQKVLAAQGFGSRRQIERWIQQGYIRINGRTAQLGDRIGAEAQLTLHGQPLKKTDKEPDRRRILLYNKPKGEICTRQDPEGRPTVFTNLPHWPMQRWIMVGRLDLNTTGLLLFSNDGELAYRLQHPSYEIEREYAVRVLGPVSNLQLQRLIQGVLLEDGWAAFSTVKSGGGTGANHWYHVVLREGRYREVRRLWESQGVKVNRLIRIRFASVLLPPQLAKGHYLELSHQMVRRLAAQVKLTEPVINNDFGEKAKHKPLKHKHKIRKE